VLLWIGRSRQQRGKWPMKRVLVLILAGGRGERMGLLCHKRAKPVLPYAGKYRVIDFSLSNCLNSHLTDIAVVTDYQRTSVSCCLDNGLPLWQRAGVSLKMISPRRGSYKGTADAVFQNLSYIEEKGADLILILAGDHVYKMDYRPFLAYHTRKHADVTVAVTSTSIEQAHRFGIVTVDGRGQIVEFREKPRLPKSNLVSMGIYVFSREALFRCLDEDSQNPSSRHDFGHSILPRMVGRDRVCAYEFTDYWRDIGTVEGYYEASLELLQDRPLISINGRWPMVTSQGEPSPVKIFSPGVLDASLAGSGCVIRGRVCNSVLSDNLVVAEGAFIKDSLILPGCFIGKHCVIDCCILDEGVNIGAGCYIGFGPGSLLGGSADLTLVGAGACIPPHTIIGRNCRILPGTAPSDFITSMVSSGSLISPGKSRI